MRLGIPRAMLYYRYQTLWETYFSQLGVQTVISGPTTRHTLQTGAALSVDETCLSARIWFGHVSELAGQCDAVFVPRVASYGRNMGMCTRFMALPDLTRATFRAQGLRVLDCDTDVPRKHNEEEAYISLGEQLGFPRKKAKQAWHEAVKADEKALKDKVKAAEQLYAADGLKVILAAHSYVYEDAWIGRPVLDFLKSNGVIVIPADLVDRRQALKQAAQLSPNCQWVMSREIMGSMQLHRQQVQGAVLMSAFPCGPDSMVNEMLSHKLQGLPMLTLTLDGQSGAAGQETRLQSFVDIIRFKEGLL